MITRKERSSTCRPAAFAWAIPASECSLPRAPVIFASKNCIWAWTGRSSSLTWVWMGNWTRATGAVAWPAAKSRPEARTGACRRRPNCSAWPAAKWISVPIAGAPARPACVVKTSAWRPSRACATTSSSSRCKAWRSGCPRTLPGRGCSMPTSTLTYRPAGPRAPSSSMPAAAPCVCAKRTSGWTSPTRPCACKVPWARGALTPVWISRATSSASWR
ncbi:hypothetical protein D3C81_933540 [compost metagenome]